MALRTCNPCSPTCNRCKPAEITNVRCLECGRSTPMTREACLHFLGRPHRVTDREREMVESGEIGEPVCRKCGADLHDALERQIRPTECSFSGIVCGYPCGRCSRMRLVSDEPCETQVPMGRFE